MAYMVEGRVARDSKIHQFLSGCLLHVDEDEDKVDIDGVVSPTAECSEFLEGIKSRLGKYHQYPALYEEGFPAPISTYLLYGLSGTGKSYMVRAIASYAREMSQDTLLLATCASDVRLQQVIPYPERAEKCLKALFSSAKEAGRGGQDVIIFLDGVDMLFAKKDFYVDPLTGDLLQDIFRKEVAAINDGIAKNVVVIATTNRPGSLDSAVWQSFQKKVHVPLPSLVARGKLFYKEMGVRVPRNFVEHDYAEFASRTVGYSGRDIQTVVKYAWEKTTSANVGCLGLVPPLEKETVLKAIKDIPSSIPHDEVDALEGFLGDQDLDYDYSPRRDDQGPRDNFSCVIF